MGAANVKDHPAVRAYFSAIAALAAADDSGLAALASPEFVLDVNGRSTNLAGMLSLVNDVWRVAAPRVNGFGFMQSVEHRDPSVVDGHTATIPNRMTIQHRGPFQLPDGSTIKPSNRLVGIDGVHTVTVADDDLITRLEIRFDEAKFVTAIS